MKTARILFMDRFESIKEYADKKAKNEENKNFILQFEYERLLEQLNKLEDRISKLCSLANYCQEKEILHFPTAGARISLYPEKLQQYDVCFRKISTKVKGKLFVTDGKEVKCESGVYKLEELVKATSIFVSNFPRFEAKLFNFIDTLTYRDNPVPKFTTIAGHVAEDAYRKPFCQRKFVYLSIATTKKELKQIFENLLEIGFMPMIPQLYFPSIDEEAMRECWENWLDVSDELWVIGDDISLQMKQEIAFAIDKRMKVKKFSSVEQMIVENTPSSVITESEPAYIDEDIDITYVDDILPEDTDVKN